MRCCPPDEACVRRAQPWLGTLVEVALPVSQASAARFDAAFAAIAQVHRRMHPRARGSDLLRIARRAHRAPVRVHAQTFAVLELAQRLWRDSGGRFDPAVSRRGAGLAALQLSRGRHVRCSAPLQLNLGGIAKGYAVDRAVDALRAAGVQAGLVNAGGDLRVFGSDRWWPVQVRAAAMLAPLCIELREAALATSGAAGGPPRLHDPRRGRARRHGGSLSVAAADCASADALTKPLALNPPRGLRLLRRHRAHALRLSAAGRAWATFEAATPHLRLSA